jgi:hypothetical protein
MGSLEDRRDGSASVGEREKPELVIAHQSCPVIPLSAIALLASTAGLPVSYSAFVRTTKSDL